jgi:uncharacterized protein
MTAVNGRLLMMLLVVPAAALAGTASFDCSKASARVEMVICADPLLSDFDVALANAYRTTLSQSFSSYEIRQQQRSWLKRRNACRDADCVRAAYRLRLAELVDDPRWIPADDWWFLTANENPEVHRLIENFASRAGYRPTGRYFDLGRGAYFILMELGEAGAGLWYAIPAEGELLKLLGPPMAVANVQRSPEGQRTFRFEVHTPRYEGVFDVEVPDRPATPKVTVVRERNIDEKY